MDNTNSIRAKLQGSGSASQNLAITIYTNKMFGSIRTAGTPDEPMFCLADICMALDLTPSKVVQRLDDGVLSKYPIIDSLGRQQNANFVNEDGLYDVILDSRKPEAKAFRKWITSEVLPQIRKTGGYIPVSEQDDDNTILAKAVLVAQRTIEQKDRLIEQKQYRIDELEGVVDEQATTISHQNETLAELAPKGKYYDNVLRAEGTYTARQLAKEFQISVAELYGKLMDKKFIYKQGGVYMPYKKYEKSGLFSTRTVTITHSNGMVTSKCYLVFTEKFRAIVWRNRLKRMENQMPDL